jgi:hypothetical protein
MKRDLEIRRKALRATMAVTASAMLFAGVGCSNDDDTTDPGWDVREPETDTGREDADVEGDVADDADDVSENDSGPGCNEDEADGVCPQGCHSGNDVDCCERGGGFWAGGCAVEGPFVPPSMPA